MLVRNGYNKYGFDVHDEGILKAEDMQHWMDSDQRTDPRGISFELGIHVDGVEAGFFMLVPTIRELFILNPECDVAMTDETVELFHKNDVLIRGPFDGAAEQFAKQYGLRFMHSDIELAMDGDYNTAAGIDVISLCFKKDYTPYIHQDNKCVGSSAGWCGGGEIDFDLPDKFYLNMSAKDLAKECWKSCEEGIKNSEELKTFLKKAKEKGGYYIDYSKKAGK